jgi:hypothetical protein
MACIVRITVGTRQDPFDEDGAGRLGMKTFGGGIDNEDIDRVVARSIDEYLGPPDQLGTGNFDSKFDFMVNSLKQWADSNDLSMWKRSRIFAGIEVSLQRYVPRETVADLVKNARNTICG